MKRNYLTLGLISLALAACGGGENGLDGKDGKDGGSCTITNNEDGSATITCPDGSSFTVKNGENGHKGDAGSDGEKGEDGQSCKLVENSDGSAAVVCPADGSSFIVRGNTDNYANYCAPGFYGKNCENECPVCGEHSKCNDGITGDGSCICEQNYYGRNCENECNCQHGSCNDGSNGNGSCSCFDAWSDEDCSVCPAGYYDGVTDCVDCRKGTNGSAFDTDKCTLSDGRTNPVTIYKVVKINNQFWMAENMRYPIGTYYHADNSEANDALFGLLYDYPTASSQNFCPSGWHLPKKDDFANLVKFIIDNCPARCPYNYKFLSLIKNDDSWKDYQNQSLDVFGFGAMPAGLYNSYHEKCDDFGKQSCFWSATNSSNVSAYSLFVADDTADTGISPQTLGLSVRCIKD